jgi:hypothetical protein
VSAWIFMPGACRCSACVCLFSVLWCRVCVCVSAPLMQLYPDEDLQKYEDDFVEYFKIGKSVPETRLNNWLKKYDFSHMLGVCVSLSLSLSLSLSHLLS